MKSIDLNTSLIFITFALSIAIFLSLLFGCSYKNRREMFENDEKKIIDAKDVSKLPEKTETKLPEKTDTKLPEKIVTKKPTLLPIEEKVRDGVKDGTITEEFIMELIKKKEFTKENLQNIIKSVSADI